MFNVKNLTALILFFVSAIMTATAYAGASVWEKSYQLALAGKYEQAASVIETIADSGNEFAVLRYAYLLYLQGENADSISYYSKAIELNPDSIDAKLGITLPLIAQKRWRQVKSYSMQVLHMSHWNYTAHVRLMLAEEGLRKWGSLAEHAAQLAKAYPSDATALVYLARAHAWQGDVAAAKAAYRKVLVRVPGHLEASAYLKNN